MKQMIKFSRATKESRARDKKRKRIILTIPNCDQTISDHRKVTVHFHVSQKEGKKLHKQLGKLLRG
jgi:hypothetical protein